MDGADLTAPPTMMSSIPGVSPPSSRPTLGFPLGTALLLIVIFCLSGAFSCCYHWDKLQSLRRRYRRNGPSTSNPGDQPQELVPSPSSKFSSACQNLKQDKEQSLPVIMPGDRVPKFMAWPCPCRHSLPIAEQITVAVVLSLAIPTISTPTQHVN